MFFGAGQVQHVDWPQRASDMNPFDSMWSEVQRSMQGTWPVLIPTNNNELWAILMGLCDEVSSGKRYIRSLIESMTRRMKSVVEA
jgi:hypothetical protein